MDRVLLGMSGGLDSTWAVRLLKEAGYQVEGAVLQMHDYTEIEAAKESARTMDVPLHIIDCRDRFSEKVVRNFVSEYESGRTPNPCILCNPEVKFWGLKQAADALGIRWIATGHYARIRRVGDRLAIAKAKDPGKDQSYMLYRLEEEVLSRLILPLADTVKTEMRQEVAKAELAVLDRPESQEVCFIQGEGYREYLERVCGPATPGSFVDEEGRVLGVHRGIRHYTVGQRKGLGISASTRLFVKRICPGENTVVLSSSSKESKKAFFLDNICCQGVSAPKDGAVYSVMLRYRARPVAARLEKTWRGWRVILEGESGAITPGQSAVFYQDDWVAFGGIVKDIEQT